MNQNLTSLSKFDWHDLDQHKYCLLATHCIDSADQILTYDCQLPDAYLVLSYLIATVISGAPWLLRPPRPRPCLNFGLQSQPGGQIMPTTVLWALSGTNSPWRP